MSAPLRCPVHHGDPAIVCPQPELADVLDTLRALAINPRLVDERRLTLDQCGGCTDRASGDGWLPETAIARITYVPFGGRAVLGEDACPLCLPEMVTWHRTYRATDIRVWLPVRAVAMAEAS